MSSRCADTTGSLLLETLVALLVLSIAGLLLVTHAAAVSDQAFRVRALAEAVEEASVQMASIAALDRRELEIRLGLREVGRFAIQVDRPSPELFRVGIKDLQGGPDEILATLLYRPAVAR